MAAPAGTDAALSTNSSPSRAASGSSRCSTPSAAAETGRRARLAVCFSTRPAISTVRPNWAAIFPATLRQAGVVYKLTPTSGGKWQLSTLYAFKGTLDGNSSYGGLVSDAKGNLYGTTYYGGSSNSNCVPVGGCGTVFALIKGSNGMWRESVLYRFQGGADGSNPTTTLVFDANGKLYGTTASGGDTNGDGVVFKLTPNSGGKWKESVVHRCRPAVVS
jgi:uncharacterized repeat protein (TIGR03803 family)